MPALRRPRSSTEYGDTKPVTLLPIATSLARSKRSTSAPRSASNIPANCTGPILGSSRTRMPSSGPGMSVELQDARRILVQELRPHVIAKRHVRHLGEDPVDVETHGVVARVDDLVGTTCVRELDDLFVVVLRRERRRRVVEVWPLQHQLYEQRRPRFTTVTRDDLQLGEVPAH